jgi:hypothetical protein
MASIQWKSSMSDAIAILTDIRNLLRQLVDARTKTGAVPPMPTSHAPIAPDSDLDSQYGNPVIKTKDPRDWGGDSMMGRKFSECPADYLDLVASRLDYFAEKADAEGKTTGSGKPVGPYNRKDAARARGWAKRIRSGRVVQRPSQTGAGWAEDRDDETGEPF